VPHVGEQGSWGATRDEKIVVRRGGAWIILKLGRYSVARRGGAARNKFRGADGEENKNAAGLGIKEFRVLRRRGTGPVRGLLKKIQRRIQTKIYGTCICGGSDF
jgi:hypothetical protein